MESQRTYVPKPVVFAVALLLVAAAAVGGYLLYKSKTGLKEIGQSTINSISPVAKAVGVPESSSPDDKTVTVLIYYDGYKSSEDALHYVGLMEATLKSVEPYASASNLKVRTFTNSKSKCHTEKHGGKDLLVCDKSLITDINKLNIKYFKLAIISPLNFVPNAKVSRGKNSVLYLPTYQGALTPGELDQFVSRYFVHELGHTFGLRDEYARQRPESAIGDVQSAQAESSNVAFQPAQPNCAPDKATAEKWWGAYVKANVSGVGYYSGCAGREDYYYPVQGTLMSDDPTVETYGRVSEDYLRNVLQCFYAGQSAVTYPAADAFAGMTTNCSDFKKQYPDFWNQ